MGNHYAGNKRCIKLNIHKYMPAKLTSTIIYPTIVYDFILDYLYRSRAKK